ncbi:hypothetical protein PTKIN_Ptkin02bG0241800 [Pterospermum kingtungense]
MELFIKTLTQTDIHKRFAIPTNSLMHFPGFRGRYSVDFNVKDKSHRLWTFRCSIRKRSYRKPVFSSGWLEFIRLNNLRIGDKITVRKEHSDVIGVGQYKIEVRRKITLLGKDVWADVL